MWYLAMEILGKGAAVPYERCVKASTARAPEPSQPDAKRERVVGIVGPHRLRIARPRRIAAVLSMRGDARGRFPWDQYGRRERR